MHQNGRSGIYNGTVYRSMLAIELTPTELKVQRSYFGLRGKALIDIPLEQISHVSLRRSVMMLFILCVEVEWQDSRNQRQTLLFGTFKRRAWLEAFAQAGVTVLPQQPLRA